MSVIKLLHDFWISGLSTDIYEIIFTLNEDYISITHPWGDANSTGLDIRF